MNPLFRTTGFIPFIVMIFLNAFVDLGHKIIIQNTIFKIYDGTTQIILTAIVNTLILLPFILLLSPSGALADRYKKPSIMRWAAIVAVDLTVLITIFYYLGWFELAFAMTFALAIQSAFYSSAKYSYIAEIAGKNRLAAANGIVQATTIIAILLGMLVFSIFFEAMLSDRVFANEADIIRLIAPIGWLLVLASLIELYAAFHVPDYKQPEATQPFDWQHYRKGQLLKNNLGLLVSDRTIWLSVVGLSIFWGLSQVVLATFPAYAKEILTINNTVIIQGLLACSGLGIITGSLFAGTVSDKYIEKGLIPLGASGIAITLYLLTHLTSHISLAINILAFGVFGGLFIVPLNSLIQFHARAYTLGRVIAGNNWLQHVVMASFLMVTVGFSLTNIHSKTLLNLLTLVALGGAVCTVYKLAKPLVRYMLKSIVLIRYRVITQGLNHIPSQGAVLMLGNHISWLDWAMVQIASSRPIHFVMSKQYYERWYLSWLLDLLGVIPIADKISRGALETVNQHLKEGHVVCLFPEGSISKNGQLGEFKRGFCHCINDVDGIIAPFYLHGLWGSHFSRASNHLKSLKRPNGLRRTIIVAFGKPLNMNTTASAVKNAVRDLSIDTWQHYVDTLPSLAKAWVRRAKQQGNANCLTDIQTNVTISRRKALTISLLFARRLSKQKGEQYVGLLLPTSSTALLLNMATFISGKTVINLNFTASIDSLRSVVKRSDIKTIYTARQFIQKLAKKGIVLDDLFICATPIYLEDIKDSITLYERCLCLFASCCLPTKLLLSLFDKPACDVPAIIVFSSGSEGEPKGIMLSQQNIMANIKQVSHVLDIRSNDIIVASLPVFHSFGMTITGLLPLIEGIPTICHPDPTDVLTIAKGINRYRATIFCGTSTLLRLFNKNGHIQPSMLASLRITISGAEKLNSEVRDSFSAKFNKIIYEGYGVTETSPATNVNMPDYPLSGNVMQIGNKQGTVGLPLPGTNVRIINHDTMAELATGEDGLILIGGPQVMQGYLKDPAKTAEAIVNIDGRRWYKTGDKGYLDEDGFLVIVDRYSRFAKTGGEMVSLGAVEAAISLVLPENVEILATTLPCAKKGEKIVLLYAGDITENLLEHCIRKTTITKLMTPALLIAVDYIPKLGSGKNDFGAARKMASLNLIA